MSDAWMDRLSEYVDGELPAAEREALETHLGGCGDCRLVVGELREVRRRAGGLEDRPPAGDLWPGIAARIGAATSGAEATAGVIDLPSRRARRVAGPGVVLTVPQLVAAAAAFLLLGGSAVWLAGGRGSAGADAADGGAPVAAAPAGGAEALRPVAAYESAIRQLELELALGRERLDPATVRTIEASLATIDRAIEQARRALEQDPANAYLNRHVSQALARKVDLLTRANALTRA